ncbi:MAG: sugar phosphate isomerase/epimerase [Ruminococcaceae bacterium]|nr:sugar phosphate isomerase/epimerase [Oscillospiraceae bacterium]
MNFSMYAGFSRLAGEKGWEYAAETALNFGCSSVETLDFMGKSPIKSLQTTEDAKVARSILEKKGLTVACCSAFINLYKSPDAVEFLKQRAEIAAALNSPFLHHTLLYWCDVSEDLPPFDEALECAIDAAEEIAKYAETLGVTCIYEDQGFYANGIDNYRLFFNEMKRRCTNVGVCGDMGNSLFVDVPGEEFFKAFASDIKHVHAKDYFSKNGSDCPGKGWYKSWGGTWLHDAPMGEGIVDMVSCFNTLKEVGYTGAVAIEADDIETSLKYLRSIEI